MKRFLFGCSEVLIVYVPCVLIFGAVFPTLILGLIFFGVGLDWVINGGVRT